MPRIAIVSNSPHLKGNYIWPSAPAPDWQVQTFLPFPLEIIDPALRDADWTTQTNAIQAPSLSESFRIDVGLRRALKAFKPDLIHFVGEPWGIGLRISASVGVPTVIHGAENRYAQGRPFLDRLRISTARHNLGRVSGAVGWNVDTLLAMKATGLPDHTPTAVLPATTRLRKSAVKGSSRINEGYLTVCFVGRLVPEKGVNVLVDAVKRSGSRVRLRIVGDGPLKSELELQARPLADQIEFLGSLTQEAAQDMIRMSDVLVLPSRDEGYVCEQFGLVLVEAMAEGTGIVASDVCSIPEVVKGYAELVPPDSAEALAAVLSRLATDDDELARLSRISADRYESYSPYALSEIAKSLWMRVLLDA